MSLWKRGFEEQRGPHFIIEILIDKNSSNASYNSELILKVIAKI